jgi:hypothetical protein
MREPIRILLQTTIPDIEDDWNIGRFSLLGDFLASQVDEDGNRLFAVTARNRVATAADPVLSTLDRSSFDELWLFAVDVGDGIPPPDCEGITRFHQGGGGLLLSRDHQDLGSSLCDLGGVGRAHFFHSKNPEPDASRHAPDDVETSTISWPNYHSGRNGDYQSVTALEPIHDLLIHPTSRSGVVELFPAHPHEGAVGAPSDEHAARVIATSKSVTTGRPFNLAVAFERAADEQGKLRGRGVAESSFHHFADYNWDVSRGCPSFVTELPGDAVQRDPTRLDDIKTYLRNLALWLAPAALQ